MNKLLCAVKQRRSMVFALILGSSHLLLADGNTPVAEADHAIEERILALNSSVDVQYSSEVRKRVRQYTVSQRSMCEKLIGRSKVYFPRFEKILEEKGLPNDLKYLSVVESGLNPAATSRSGAAGLWQFMRPTGRMMGLKITRTIDERRDVEKSTAAAADYLLKLYTQFDDWTLAIAAYNCGPGNMRKAIRKSGGKRNFWDLKKYLPKETREYVPKFIAMSYVMNYYYEHDMIPLMPHEDLMNTSSARVFESINLRELSRELDIELQTMNVLNPSFIRNYIPQSEDGKYELVLPTREMRIVAQKYHVLADLPKLEERVQIAAVAVTARPRLELEEVPAAIHLGSQDDDAPAHLRSLYAHPVVLQRDRKKRKTGRPDAYFMDQRRKSIYQIATIAGIKRKA